MNNYVTSLGIALTLALPHVSQAQSITPLPVPTKIEVGTNEVAESSAHSVSFMKPNVNLDPFTVWDVKGWTPATRLTIRSDRFLQAPRSNRSGARARSKKLIVAGAIAGAVGGFFAGGFLGAHIEGDRCDCDDPGVRGFLIGAPIGAVAGAIAGGKFLF